jgi:hypothetical protein
MYWPNHSGLASPHISTASQSSAPHNTAHIVSTRISTKWWSVLPITRGSGIVEKLSNNFTRPDVAIDLLPKKILE